MYLSSLKDSFIFVSKVSILYFDSIRINDIDSRQKYKRLVSEHNGRAGGILNEVRQSLKGDVVIVLMLRQTLENM